MTDTDMTTNTAEFEQLPPSMLDLLERQMIALLCAIWKAQGKNKRVVTVKDKNNEQEGNQHFKTRQSRD